MEIIFILAIIVAVAMFLYNDHQKGIRKQERQRREEQLAAKRAEQEEAERQNTARLIRTTELLKQAKAVGDKDTISKITANNYDGELPERRADGAWMSVYDNLRILKIAGMKYRGDLSAYIGEFNGTLVPEPQNEYDPFAIQVKCEDGHLLGYIREGQTDVVRWLVGAEQPLGEDKPTIFPPYRITGTINQCTDEADGHTFFDGCVYIVKK